MHHEISTGQDQRILPVTRHAEALDSHGGKFLAHFVQRYRDGRVIIKGGAPLWVKMRIQSPVLCVSKHQRPTRDCGKQNDQACGNACPTVKLKENATEFHKGEAVCMNHCLGAICRALSIHDRET
jgi:hypothetical protein